MAVAVQATVVDASNNLGNNNAKLYPTDETELQESKNASAASLAKGQKTASKLEPVETIATADECDLPIVSQNTAYTRSQKTEVAELERKSERATEVSKSKGSKSRLFAY